MNIILYLLQLIQQLYQQNCFLINFICKYIPLKQWAFDDSHSPKYQKFKIDQLPLILNVEPWNYLDYMLSKNYTTSISLISRLLIIVKLPLSALSHS